MMENEKKNDLMCPLCASYGFFDGKKCTRCGGKRKGEKFVYTKYQPFIDEVNKKYA
jgi:hypothetical protein